MSDSSGAKGVAIVGGGITGLYAALQALDRGQADIHVYEASNRFGGKVQSAMLGDHVVNLGAEFIDSDNTRLIELCRRLNVPLEKSEEQGEELFQRPDGSLMDGAQFHAAYAPIAAQVMRDREEMERDPNGALAQALKSVTLDQYMQTLRDRIPAAENLGLWQQIWNFITFQGNKVDATITNTAIQAFTHELGRSTSEITAAQFAFESSPSVHRLLASDCGYRIEGGTEKIIDALRQHLQARGVHFHTGHRLQALQRQGGTTQLQFATVDGQQQAVTDKLVMALPAYNLAQVQGLESIGLSPVQQQLLADVQYTQLVKFTVTLKPGIEVPDANLFSRNSECWSPAPGLLTFLCHAPADMKPQAFIRERLDNYATALGQRVDDMFDIGPGKIALTNPGKAACWSTPSPKNRLQTEALFTYMESLAGQGTGIAGSYMPLEGTVGFMECGMAASERVAARMIGPVLEQATSAQEKTPTSFAQRVMARQGTVAVPAL